MLANAQPHTNVNCFLWRWQKKVNSIQIFSVAKLNSIHYKCKLFPLHKYIWSGLDKWRKYCWCPLSCINMHKYAPRKSAIFQCIISCTFKHLTTREGFFSYFFLFYSLLKKCNSVSLSLKLPCTKLQFCLQLPRRGQINWFGEEIRIFLLHKYFFLAEKYNAQDCKRLPKENYQLHLWYVPNQLSSPSLPWL